MQNQVNNVYDPRVPLPLDLRLAKTNPTTLAFSAYADIDEAYASTAYKYPFQEIVILKNNVPTTYWFVGGTSKANLIVKNSDVNARTYGLSPANLAAANTTALQTAIDIISQNGGGIINIDEGEFKLNKITLKERVILVGKGLIHATVYWDTDNFANKKKGTLLLINGLTGEDCLVFQDHSSFTGLRNLSVVNDNANAINAVVNVPGSLYPILENLEISSRLHGPAGAKTIGLRLSAHASAPTWETLYGSYVNVMVLTNQAVGVHTALKLVGLNYTLRPNASKFLGGHFQGYGLSLLVDGDTIDSVPQGISFFGTTFESYYNSEQAIVYVPNSEGMNAFMNNQDRYAVIWMHLKKSNQVSFFGCYLEDGGNTFTWDDGTHGTHPSFPCLLVDEGALQTVIVGNTLVAGVLDKGFGTTHPNKLSMLDQNAVVQFEGVPIAGGTSSEAIIGVDNSRTVRISKDAMLVHTSTPTGDIADRLQVGGNIYATGVYKNLHTDDDFIILNPTGSRIQLQDSNNEVEIEGRPVGGGTHMFIHAEHNEVVEIGAAFVNIKENLDVDHKITGETPAPTDTGNQVVTAEWVRFQSFLPRLTKSVRDALPPQEVGYQVYVTDAGGYMSYYNGTGWSKITATAD